MAARRSIRVAGVSHDPAPIPMGARVGGVVFSSALMGMDPATGSVPDDAAQQTHLVFRNLAAFLEAAGCAPGDVGRVTVYVDDDRLRSLLNEEWVAMFPDEDSRPARHVVKHDLPSNFHIQVEVIAVASDR